MSSVSRAPATGAPQGGAGRETKRVQADRPHQRLPVPQFPLSDWGLPSPHWRTVWPLLTLGRVALTPSNSALGYVPDRTGARDSNKLRGKQPKGPSTRDGITKAWHSHMMECYSVTEKEVPIVVTTWTQVVVAQDLECAQHHWIHSSVVNFMSWQPYLNIKKILSGLGQCPPPPPTPGVFPVAASPS